MEKVRPRCGQPSDRGRLKNRTGSDSALSLLLQTCVVLSVVVATHWFIEQAHTGAR